MNITAHGPVHKSMGMKIDAFRVGAWAIVPGLYYGALDMVRTYCEKTTDALLIKGIAKSHNYADEVMETAYMLGSAVVPLMLGERTKVASLLMAAGLEWDDVGFEAWWPLVDGFCGARRHVFPQRQCT